MTDEITTFPQWLIKLGHSADSLQEYYDQTKSTIDDSLLLKLTEKEVKAMILCLVIVETTHKKPINFEYTTISDHGLIVHLDNTLCVGGSYGDFYCIIERWNNIHNTTIVTDMSVAPIKNMLDRNGNELEESLEKLLGTWSFPGIGEEIDGWKCITIQP